MRRSLASLLLILLTAGCIIPTVEYGETPWTAYVNGDVTGDRCTGRAAVDLSDKPHFLVTSRLPDCRDDPVTLTVQRGDTIRYARFGRPETVTPEKGKSFARENIGILPGARWWRELSSAAQSNGGRVFVYVHGFNELPPSTTLDSADMMDFSGFPGPMVHYSWPSRGQILGYTVDENNSEYDRAYFNATLRNIASLRSVQRITLLSHSMGARLAVPAVTALDRSGELGAKVDQVILAAPDYDRGLFERVVRDELLSEAAVAKGRNVTVYTSRGDDAVGLSRLLHGYARLGNPKCDDPVLERELLQNEEPARCYPDFPAGRGGLSIVDTTGVGASNNGHNDFLRTAAGCADFARVLNGVPHGDARMRVAGAPDYVWRLRTDADLSVCRTDDPSLKP